MRVLFLLFCVLFLFNSAFGFDRIVSLSPALTEMVVYAGAENKLVGVTNFCTIKVKAERVGGIVNPNVEKIIALKPDLILTTNMTSLRIRRVLERIAKVEVFHLVTLKELEDALVTIGSLVGSNGERLKGRFEKKLKGSLRKVYCLKGKKGVILISCNPIYVAGGRSYLGETLGKAGIDVVPLSLTFGAVSTEFVVENGDFAVLSCHGDDGRLKSLLKRFGLKVYEVPGDYLLHPSPFFLKGIDYLGEKACVLR